MGKNLGMGPFASGDYGTEKEALIAAPHGPGWYRINAAGLHRFHDGVAWGDLVALRGREYSLAGYRRFLIGMVVAIWLVVAVVWVVVGSQLIAFLSRDPAPTAGVIVTPVLTFIWLVAFTCIGATGVTVNVVNLMRRLRPVPVL